MAATFLYNEYLSRTFHGSMFLARPLPFGSWDEAQAMTASAVERWGSKLLSAPQWLGLLAVAGAAGWQQGRGLGRWHWAGHWALLLAGSLCYYGLMGRQYEVHDYYLIDTFLLPLVLLGAGSLTLLRLPARRSLRLAVWGTAAALLAAALVAARAEQVARITPAGNDPGEQTARNFRRSAQWLDSLRVPRTARLLVLDAHTYNLPLLLAGRPGWTVLNTGPAFLVEGLKLPADYVVTQNFSFATEVVNNYPLITERLAPVATNGQLSLWKLRPGPVPVRWRQFVDFEAGPDQQQWYNVPAPGAGPALSGGTAAWLRGAGTYGVTFHSAAAALGLQAGDRLLVSARYQAEEGAQGQLACTLEPAGGGPAYWAQTLPCGPTPPGAWWSVGSAFELPAPRSGQDILKVYLMKNGPGAVGLDDVELQLVR